MKYLNKWNKFNENFDNIKETINDIFLDLVDNGFDVTVQNKYYGKDINDVITISLDKGIVKFQKKEISLELEHLESYLSSLGYIMTVCMFESIIHPSKVYTKSTIKDEDKIDSVFISFKKH